jgi:hypothetical protein
MMRRARTRIAGAVSPPTPRAHLPAPPAPEAGAIIADVGSGASGPYPRTATGAMLIVVALAAAQLLSQSLPAARGAAPPDEMLSDLAGRIAAAIAPAVLVHLDAADAILEAAVVARLSASGVHVVEQTVGVPVVRVDCRDNLRDRVCSAVVAGATTDAILVARPRESPGSPPIVRVTLELRPILSLDRRILDAVRTDDEMLVLTEDALLRYEEARTGWRLAESLPLSNTRPSPRDMRGRLRMSSTRVEVFLPGVTCAGSSNPLTVTCADGSAAWPLDIDAAYLDPLRNYFSTGDGLTFYGVARLSNDPKTRWLAATIDQRLTFVDENRRTAATLTRADDVAGLRVPCFPDGVVVASTPAGDSGALSAFEIVRRTLVPVAAPLALSGHVTALWSNGTAALVVTHHPDAGRYVANELSVSCSR